MLNEDIFKVYYNTIREEFKSSLVSADVVSKVEQINNGASYIPTLEDNSKDIIKISNKDTYSRRSRARMVYIPEHTYGFSIYDRDLQAVKNGLMPLPLQVAIDSARLIAESVDNMVFNGVPEYGIKGIYKDAENSYKVSKDKGWDTANSNPYKDVMGAVDKLEETGQYKAKFMVLSPHVYYSLAKINSLGVSYLKMIEDAGIFPNGRNDIYMAPVCHVPEHSPIIPPGSGVIGDYSPNIAERYVQQSPHPIVLPKDESKYTDIILEEHIMDKDRNWNFNVLSYQGFDMHRPDAFVRLENLIQ